MDRPRRVLVVDDDTALAEICARLVQEMGCDAKTASGGVEGLSLALREDCDLVVTDLRMSDLDGMEVLRKLAKERPGTGVIVMSGFAGVPSAVEAAKLGASDFIEKPFTAEQFVETVRKALSDRESAPCTGGHAAEAAQIMQRLMSDDAFRAEYFHEGVRVLSGFALKPGSAPGKGPHDISWVETPLSDRSP